LGQGDAPEQAGVRDVLNEYSYYRSATVTVYNISYSRGEHLRGLEAEYQPVAYQKDYYAILQVNRNAKQDDIEKAYKRLSSTYDPSTSNKKRAAQRHADVAAAYAVLRDPRRRRQYDRQLASDLASAGSMRPADVLSNRFVLLGSGIIFITVLVILGLVLLVGGGSSSSNLVSNVSPTATPAATPAQTAPASPPAVSGTPTTLADGLQYIIVTPGAGNPVASGDTVTVQYSGWLQNTGALFDSSYNTGQPFSFALGAGNVIKGWDEGVAGMLPGETRRLIIPPALGYGDAGQPPKIPAAATLVFDITLQSATTPTPVGQTPAPTPPASPPAITGTSTTLPDGLQYTIFQAGTGDTAAASGESVTVNYSGWLQATGALFDSSLNSGRTPFTFTLGAGNVIKGWDEGVVGMKIGEKRRLTIPAALAYGANARGPIPANSALIFDVELLSAAPTTPTPVVTATPTASP
jgi:FKBP-type peptidyl-prolyl cis-trans isomerase